MILLSTHSLCSGQVKRIHCSPVIAHPVITWMWIQQGHVVPLNFVYRAILQRNYRKMTMNGHFPIILCKLVYNEPLITWSIFCLDPKHSVIQGLHCNQMFRARKMFTIGLEN